MTKIPDPPAKTYKYDDETVAMMLSDAISLGGIRLLRLSDIDDVDPEVINTLVAKGYTVISDHHTRCVRIEW